MKVLILSICMVIGASTASAGDLGAGWKRIGDVILPQAHAECSAVCDPEVSKPCGLVCISKYKSCHRPTTSACMGAAGRSIKKTYAEPKHVEPSEQQKANEAVSK